MPGLVEAWAAGASWQEVMADTDLDDGDMARLLARTADMLKQVRWGLWGVVSVGGGADPGASFSDVSMPHNPPTGVAVSCLLCEPPLAVI